MKTLKRYISVQTSLNYSSNDNVIYEACVKISPDCLLNTDCKTTYTILKDRIFVLDDKVH